MELLSKAHVLTFFVCNILFSLLSGHGFGEQTLIKTPQGLKKIHIIAQRVSKNKTIISHNLDHQKNTPSLIRTSGHSTTNCYISIGFHKSGTNEYDEILCTPMQEFYLPITSTWVPALQLRVGDQLKSALYGNLPISQIQLVQAPLSVYMLEVKKHHNFLVGKQEILTHNTTLPWEVAIWVCIPFGEVVAGASAGSVFGPIGIMGGAVIGSIVGYGLHCIADHDKVHIYDSFFNVNSIQALMKESLNLTKPSANPPSSTSTPSPDASGASEEPSSADNPETTCPIEKILKGLTKDSRPKSRKPNDPSYADIYEKPEGDSFIEWQSLPLNDKITKPKKDGTVIHIGKLPDGRVVTSREKSDDGRPTLEIYDHVTEKSIKIRYPKLGE